MRICLDFFYRKQYNNLFFQVPNQSNFQLYLYNKTNDIDAETGKFRLMEGGGSDIEQFIGTTAEWNDLPAADKEKYDGKEVIITDDYDGDAADTIELTSCTILGTLITAATLGSSLSNTLMLPFANSHLYNFTIAQLMIRGVGADDIQKWNVTPIPYVGYILTRTAPTVAMHGQYILSGTFTKK